ncbi:hypothetical protein [Mycolicibacterium aichiense]|uniref:Cullin, a subunit of E3 ubiquitin ligase n=1 Tax=Mycolicibacterium aichiense TaxID=1799 RepID=A0AAD1MD53_9MYCO|nr:hypothetical protein [Mycolicibacterium aichiense]MCV7017379.1 hypothetical protein [Mycolicibacterium aichiense]BBX10187.1 hypothetical protein MAIC_49900 [Mycolicibacterium aichiense]STZ26147.1 cullin, a subunit of E3 ubiquitin ligase [Mycolicibacterium aichiense]
MAEREVFLAREALADGRLTRSELARWYQPLFRGVYMPKGDVTLWDRAKAAWLATGRQAVITGVAASGLYGSSWVDADTPIELISPRHARPQRGLVVRQESLAPDEVTKVSGIPVVARARAAFDLGRHLRRGEAIARMDALMRNQVFSAEDVLILAKRYPGVRGLRQLGSVLPLVDGGAASPQETRLRLLYIDSGLPRPTTQVPVFDGWRAVRVLDLGWEEFRVGSEYDGDVHRTDRRAYVKDLRLRPKVESLGWAVDHVIKEDRDDEIVGRATKLLRSRGWRP